MTRAETTAKILALRSQGLLLREIAAMLGLSPSTVRNYASDPTGSKGKARRQTYRGVCKNCGGPTDGSNGPRNVPSLCLKCTNAARAAKHGTRSKYAAGCRCDDCRRANREDRRKLRGRPAPSHGTSSGYFTYGCKCDLCRAVGSELNRRQRERRKARAAA